MLAITLIFGLASIFTIIHISKGARIHQLNSRYIQYVTDLSDQLDYPESHPPSLHQILDTLYKIRQQADSCLSMTNSLDRMAMDFIGTSEAINLCKINLGQSNVVINRLKKQIESNPNNYMLDKPTHDYLLDIPGVLQTYSSRFESLIDKTVEFTITVALWFITPFSLLVFVISFTIIRSVTRNARQYRETAEALAESEIQNRALAYYDSLTRLPNRNLLSDRLEQILLTARREGSSFALIFVDLDRFKHVNDTLGHVAGDELIKQAADRIKSGLRASDTLSRFGGDEFVIILPNLRSTCDASTVAKKIIHEVAKPFSLEGINTHVTASLGIAVYPDNGRDISTLMKRADIAMYLAKDNGKNQFFFYNNEINKKADKRLLLERDLRKSIDDDELILHYQPVVNLQSGQIVGVEALLRWQHGKEGMISPGEFIPIAEDTGLIVDIGNRVIEMACQQCQIWRLTNSSDIHVAVNVSARQLREENLVTFIQDCLANFSLPPEALEIEITESAFYNNDTRCIETLNKLDEMDLKLLLDDFGTGYSSLSTLRSMPFDIIKIDRSFIQTQNEKNRKITESILDMAENFDMQVVAEGIEESNMASFLKYRGCKYGQGYLFKNPVPASEIDFNDNFSTLIDFDQPLKLANNNH